MAGCMAALAADWLLGEPPSVVHPTVWMGRWVQRCRRTRRSTSPARSLVEGAVGLAAGVAASALAGGVVDRVIGGRPGAGRSLHRGLALVPAISLRSLVDAANDVRCALAAGDLENARRRLGWHLVSRDVSRLDAHEVAGAAIESVAENLSDAVVAPILAFRFGGLAGAYAYRMINTADAMLGYRTAELEWFGKFAARADDAANLIPARVTALAIGLAAGVGHGSTARALSIAARDAGRTSSPNAGWPMAAMAGALGVRLTKRDQYSLNDAGRPPVARDITRACRIVVAGAALAALAADLL